MSLADKIQFIQTMVDDKFRIILNQDWSSKKPNYRQEIRKFLGQELSALFTRQQLVQLIDLNWLPQCAEGSISISHCEIMGGVTISQYNVGFDVEETRRISTEIIRRVSNSEEVQMAPMPELLWGAKEAGFKALSKEQEGLIIADLEAYEWMSYYENQIFGFRLKSKKTLEFGLNKGIIFFEESCSMAFFFK